MPPWKEKLGRLALQLYGVVVLMGLLDTPRDAVVRKVAVLGKGGCGKSSLITCLTRKQPCSPRTRSPAWIAQSR